jgi:hypothetical protein
MLLNPYKGTKQKQISKEYFDFYRKKGKFVKSCSVFIVI